MSQILIDIVDSNKKRFPACSYCSLLAAYILHLKLNQKWKAIYELLQISSQHSVDSRVSLAGYDFLHSIEREMLDSEIKKRDLNGVNVISLIEYQKLFSDFFAKIKQAFNLYQEFWSELTVDRPRLNHIKLVGVQICASNDTIEHSYAGLIEQAGTQLKAILLYGNYLKFVVNDNEESDKIMKRALNLLNNTQMSKTMAVDDKTQRYSDANNVAIIVASGDKQAMGLIKSINSETLKLFGFSTSEISGKTVDILMPRIYAANHDQYSFFITDG